jgi:signal transduction histidine kinase
MPGALDYSRKALDLAEKSQDLFSAGSACINLGNTLKDLNRIDEGARYIERAYAIGHQLHDSNMMETALIDIGDTYLRKGKPDKYIPVYQKALGLARTLGDVSGQAFGMQGLAYGLFYKSQYPAAEAFLKQAIPFARDNDQKEVWRGLLLLMSDVQAVLGNLDAYHRYRDLSDSVSNAIVNESLLKNVQELETKYKVEKQQHDLLKKDLLLAEKDKAAVQQHNWLIAAIAGILLLGILVVMIWLISRQQQQLQSRTIRALEAEQENVRLKAMLEGQQQERQRISQEMHDDMGSGLTSLLFLSRALDPAGNETALKMNRTAEQLIRKMNEIIWSMNPEQDTLDNLLAYIRTNTAELLEYAGIDFRFDIREPAQKIKVNSEFRSNIYLVAKEAVHNIVRHSGASRVVISILVEDMKLEITVRDNGKGFDPATNSRFGNGLKNMRRRMEQINGEIDFDRDGGAIVSIRAPLGPV